MEKILFLTSSYPAHKEDVHSMFMRDLTLAITIKEYEVIVLCPNQPGLRCYEVQDGIKIFRFPYWFTRTGQLLNKKGGIIPSINQSPLAIFQLFLFSACQLLFAFKIAKNEKIDIIHSHWIIPQGLIGAIIQLITGIPHISSIHGTDIHLVHSHRLAHPLIRVISKYSNIITTNSSHTYRLLQDLIPYNRINSQVIPMGINPEEFSSKPHFDIKHQKNILFVGRLITLKGTDILIEALKNIHVEDNSIQLFIVGEGPEQKSLEILASDLDITSNVRFLGNLPRNELGMCYKNASVFVLPSITYKDQSEGLGVVLLEAMASGAPVIGTDTGGIPDIIKDGINGLLVPPGDPYALADAIIRIFENPDLADRFREAGLKTVRERFSWDKISDQFIEVYQGVLHESNEV
ncbi:D-inositol-3-phosphate glycosyltransferase [anaerobic digester metagenome]